MFCHIEKRRLCVCLSVTCDKQAGKHPRGKAKRLTLKRNVANLAGKQNIKMAFPQFAELWKLIDLLVRKDFRQANLGGRVTSDDFSAILN
jgi:hypothetical protein